MEKSDPFSTIKYFFSQPQFSFRLRLGWVFGIFFLVLCLFVPSSAQAASLYFSPSASTHNIGSTFTLNIIVNSVGQAMNAASGVVNFPTDKLEVVSLTKSGSIFSLWVQDPSFNNSSGQVNFEGIVLNPGFNGASGRLLSITFKAKAAGSATVSLSSGLVLANDGQGTNITSSLGQAKLTIKASEPASTENTLFVPSPPPANSQTSAVSRLSSVSHPYSNQWYSVSTALFSWNLSKDVTAVRLLLSANPNDRPSVVYRPPISERRLDDLEDGVWYFSAQAQNQFGWGRIEQFKIQIDTVKPDNLSIKEAGPLDSALSEATFVIKSQDSGSGISHYEIQVDDEPTIIWRDDGSGAFTTSNLSTGSHKLVVKAFDHAGNFLIDIRDFTIEGLAAPVINDWSMEVFSNDYLVIKGESKYPNSQITLFWQAADGEIYHENYYSNKDGQFVIVNKNLVAAGRYNLWLTVKDDNDLVSNPSDVINITVKKEPFINMSSRAINSIKFFIPLLFLIIVSSVLAIFVSYRLFIFRKRVDKKVAHINLGIKDILAALNRDVKKKILSLENKDCKQVGVVEKKKILKRIIKDLEKAENKIDQEIQNIKN